MMVMGLLIMAMAASCAMQGGGSREGFSVSSEAFLPGEPVPVRFTCRGANTSPAVSWDRAPAGTKSFVLILDDPDAPGGIFTHWLVYGIPGDRLELPAALPKAKEAAGGIQQGINDFGTVGYRGPCPPEGPPHRYVLTLYALDVMVTLEGGAERQALESAMKGHILGGVEAGAVFGR